MDASPHPLRNALAVSLFMAALGSQSTMGELPPPTLERDGVRCWHDVAYGPRDDLPDEGEGYTGNNGGWSSESIPWKFHRHRSGQYLDVYAPTGEIRPDATVVLFLHGGSWSECYDKDGPRHELFKALVDAGAIACTADYILQTDRFRNWFAPSRKEATFAEMLRDIDAAVTKIGEFARELGVVSPRLVISGESAGGHLALLYAYEQGNPERIGLALSHTIPVAKVVGIVAPTDFTSREFQEIGSVPVLGFKVGGGVLKTLMNRLAGLPDNATRKENRDAAGKWSPIKLVCANSVSTALAYGAIGEDETTDGVVPVSQTTSLEAALKAAGVPCATRKFSGTGHGDVAWKGAAWIAEQALTP